MTDNRCEACEPEPPTWACPWCRREFDQVFRLQAHVLSYAAVGIDCKKPKTPHR